MLNFDTSNYFSDTNIKKKKNHEKVHRVQAAYTFHRLYVSLNLHYKPAGVLRFDVIAGGFCFMALKVKTRHNPELCPPPSTSHV